MVDKEGYLWGGSSDFKVHETGAGQSMPAAPKICDSNRC